MRVFPLVALSVVICLGCTAPQYGLIPAGYARIGATRLTVTPGIAWNRAPPIEDQRRWETVWTQNGPLLDRVSLVGGLPDGETIIDSYEDDPFPVPDFHADMSPDALVAMMRTTYQARGVQTIDVEPATRVPFLGGDALRFEFRYTPDDAPARRGACVLRVVDGKLYALTLDAESSHYFGALLPEFERLVASARLR